MIVLELIPLPHAVSLMHVSLLGEPSGMDVGNCSEEMEGVLNSLEGIQFTSAFTFTCNLRANPILNSSWCRTSGFSRWKPNEGVKVFALKRKRLITLALDSKGKTLVLLDGCGDDGLALFIVE